MSNNKIETLRSICFTEEDLKTITNLGDMFSKDDISFMVEFKKIYELGLKQLYKFIDKLDEDGSKLDVDSINYYTTVLNNGPLGVYVREYSADKKYFSSYPDNMGVNGNINKTGSNTTVISNNSLQLGCAVDTFNKLPDFMQSGLSLIGLSEEIFRTSLHSSTINDNTLPLVDKKSQDRYNTEQNGTWPSFSHASYMTKDVYFGKAIESVSQKIFESIKAKLGDENWRLYLNEKQYSPFNAEENTSVSSNSRVEKTITVGDKTSDVVMDLLGDVFDSEESRAKILKIESDDKDVEYLLHSNKGQLGS